MADKSFWSEKKDKSWWQNFWFYYRFRIIGAVIALAFVLVGIKQCVTRVTPDLSVSIAVAHGIPDEVISGMENSFAEVIDDIDGKNGVVADVYTVDLPSGGVSNGFEVNSAQQLFLEMAAGESYLYIMDRDRFVASRNSGIFTDISDITDGDEPTYYIDVTGNKYLESLGFKTDYTVCAGVRNIPESRKKMKNEDKKQENALKLLKKIVENQLIEK